MSAGAKALRFHPPVGHQRGGRDHQARPVGAAVLLLGEKMGERLHRLAEAHVVGQHAAEPRLTEEAQPGIPLALIRPERRGEAFRSRVFADGSCLAQPLPENAQGLAARPGNPGAGDQLFQGREFGGAAAAEAELLPVQVHPEQLVQRGEDRLQTRVRQRQQPTIVEGHEQGLSIAVFEVEEVAVGVVRHGLQKVDDLRQQVDPFPVDRDANVELEPVDAAALVQDGIDVAIGLGERRRETRLDLDPPAFLAQTRCHLDEEAGPGHGIVVGKDELTASIGRQRVGVVRLDRRQPGVGSGKLLAVLVFARAVAFDREQAAVRGEQRLVALIVGRQHDRSVGEGETCDLKILGSRGCCPGVAVERGSKRSSCQLQNRRRRASDDIRRRRLRREQLAVAG